VRLKHSVDGIEPVVLVDVVAEERGVCFLVEDEDISRTVWPIVCFVPQGRDAVVWHDE
jgi:hypothetical protein